MSSTPRCQLYLLTPPAIPDLAGFARLFADAIATHAPAALQIRIKGAADEEIVRIGKTLAPIAQAQGVAVIVNDRPDLADRIGADGVHIGQTDAPYAAARAIMGPDRVVGVTCHASRHLAMEAGEMGADYVAFGAFFPSATKTAPSQAEPEILAWWAALFEIPCVAIGGIGIEHCAGLARAGADFVAVSNAVWAHEAGPKAALAAIARELASAQREAAVDGA